MNSESSASLNRAASTLEAKARASDPVVGAILGNIASAYRSAASKPDGFDGDLAAEVADHNDLLARELRAVIMPFCTPEVEREERRNDYLLEAIRDALSAHNTPALYPRAQ